MNIIISSILIGLVCPAVPSPGPTRVLAATGRVPASLPGIGQGPLRMCG